MISHNDSLEIYYTELKEITNKLVQEIEDTYSQYKENKKFNKNVSQPKKDWYYSCLKKRIEHNIYIKNRFLIMEKMDLFYEKIFSKIIKDSINVFTDMAKTNIGDKLVYNNIIDFAKGGPLRIIERGKSI